MDQVEIDQSVKVDTVVSLFELFSGVTIYEAVFSVLHLCVALAIYVYMLVVSWNGIRRLIPGCKAIFIGMIGIFGSVLIPDFFLLAMGTEEMLPYREQLFLLIEFSSILFLLVAAIGFGKVI